MSKVNKISEAELEVMEVIWAQNPISTNDIAACLAEKSGRNERTVHTLIARLEKKGAISHIKEGRVFVYSPMVDKNEYIKTETKSFLNKFYNGAINKLVMNFIDEGMLTDEDITELKEILEKKR